MPAVATFTVDFLGCKVSHVDAHEVRDALLRDGHTEEQAGDVAVISTCCVTNEAVAKSRKAAARAARTYTRVYLTGCAANLGGTAFECPAARALLKSDDLIDVSYGMSARLNDEESTADADDDSGTRNKFKYPSRIRRPPPPVSR